MIFAIKTKYKLKNVSNISFRSQCLGISKLKFRILTELGY